MAQISKQKPVCPQCQARLIRVYGFQTQTDKKSKASGACAGGCPFAG